MQPQLVQNILDSGRDAAYTKMTLDRILAKPDMRQFGFSDLLLLLECEVSELKDEIFKTIMQESVSEELLNLIRNEAADVLAFASGIVAKCDQEIANIQNKNIPSLFDDEK